MSSIETKRPSQPVTKPEQKKTDYFLPPDSNTYSDNYDGQNKKDVSEVAGAFQDDKSGINVESKKSSLDVFNVDLKPQPQAYK